MNKEQRQYIRELYMQILRTEEQIQGRPMPELTRENFFLFNETGNRLVYENIYFERRKYLTTYAILALWSGALSRQGIIERGGDEKAEAAAIEGYVKRLEKILLSICEEQFWALPAHVDFSRIDLPETALTIDLFAAETAQALSEITLRLYDQLPTDLITRVAQEVIRRVLRPFAASAVPYSWWETDRCNWSAVCAGSVGMAAINIDALNRRLAADYMPDTRKEELIPLSVLLYRDCVGQLPANWKENCLRRACDALQCYLDGMEDDGACTEGLGYYNYGMSFYAAFAEEYSADSSLQQEPEQLMYREKCERIALFQQKCYFACRLGKGISVSFSDGGKHESFLPGLTTYLKHCYPQVQTPDYKLARPFDEDACYRYLTNERSIRWLMKYADSDRDDRGEGTSREPQPDLLRTDLLPAAQWFVCQDRNGNGFAAKGGNNNENHNHNDIGHFLCVYNGEMLLTDLGAGEYTKDYFSDRRYDILCNRSLGHSVPIINGAEQCAGGEYRADGFAWDGVENTLTISFAGAYPKGYLQTLVRRIKMSKTASVMSIELRDDFSASENTETIAENIVTEYEPVIQDDAVWIRGLRGQCSIRVENCSGSMIRIIPCAHSDHAGNCHTVYRITWDVRVEMCGNTSCKMWITFCEK